MHDTAMISGTIFANVYTKPGMTVLDIGGKDVNGSLRSAFESVGVKYVCVDIEPDKSVDIVVNPGEDLPFEDNSIDAIVSTSCFEHDPCFWITFREMCRIVKLDGYIYVNAPSNGMYHTYPGDNWRFYSDAGQALAYWSGKTIEGKNYPVEVVETFHIYPLGDMWIDFVCVWKRVTIPQKEIVVSEQIRNTIGPIHSILLQNNIKVLSKIRA